MDKEIIEQINKRIDMLFDAMNVRKLSKDELKEVSKLTGVNYL